MLSGYFHRVAKETPTRFWINLPTRREAEQAIAAGAVSCTTNPTYCARLLDVEPDYLRGLIAEVAGETDDEDVAAERVYHRASARAMELFRPIHQASGGAHGWVAIQGDPRKDDDADGIVGEALRAAKLGKNFMAKIPAVPAGIEAIEALVARNVAICATEIFAVSQAVHVCERYRRAAERSGNHPPFYLTHITGIFDLRMSQYVKEKRISIAPEVLAQAGSAVAHEQYRVFKARGFEGTLLGGGALNNSHFTEMVGGNMHVTLNWSIVQALLEADGPVVPRLEVPAPKEVVEDLAEKLPEFRQGFYEGALALEEYRAYGPLDLFRTMFVKGYTRLVEAVRAKSA